MASILSYLDLADTERQLNEEKEIIKQWKESNAANLDDNSKGPSLYERLVPKSESWLMRYMRNWERSVGFVTPLIYRNVFLISSLHIGTLAWIAFYLAQGRMFKWQTTWFVVLMSFLAGFGVTGGVHRLWSHRCYKAKTPLKIIMLFFYTIAGQNTVYHWVRNHRTHHKCSDTVADPHDSNRGLFFSHCGWLMMMRHPRVLEEGSKIDLSDIENDPLLQFHFKYYLLLRLVFCFALPGVMPALLWNEDWGMSVLSQALLRFAITLNMAWAVNSVAHKFGYRPYHKDVKGVENRLVSLITLGEGWHNYHHTFPWDYKAAELPYDMNPTTRLINFFASIGWAYDLKSASPAVIQKYVSNHGDGKLSDSDGKLS